MQSLLYGRLRACSWRSMRRWLMLLSVALAIVILRKPAVAQQPPASPPAQFQSLPTDQPAPASQQTTAPPQQQIWQPELLHTYDDLPMSRGNGWNVPPTCWYQGIGFYFRGGPAIPLNHTIVQHNLDEGVTIEAGMRQRITKGPYDFVFFDIGGSFMSVRGQRTVTTPGFVSNVLTGNSIRLFDFFNSTLNNVRRGSADLALGTYFHPMRVFGIQSNNFRAMIRGGGRFGNYWGNFHDATTPSLISAIQSISLSGATYSLHPLYHKTAQTAGLFASGGIDWIISRPDPRCSNAPIVTVGCEAEYSNDWINFKLFQKGQLQALSIMAYGTLMF